MRKTILTYLFILSIAIISCKKNIEYPIVPHLDFKDAKITKGFDILHNPVVYLILTLDYTDGDANIGREYIIDDDPNCIIKLYKKINDQYTLFPPHPEYQNPYYFTIFEIPKPRETYINGPITIKTKTIYNGEIEIKLFHISTLNPFKPGDSIRVTVQIKDNDNNNSNLAEKDLIYNF